MWFLRLLGRAYDPEQDARVQALRAAAEEHRRAADELRRRNFLTERLLPPEKRTDDWDELCTPNT